MFDSSLAASGVGRESTLLCVSDGDECVLAVCSAIKASRKHGGIRHDSKVKTVKLIKKMEEML